MTSTVLLDAGPLGLVTNPNASTENVECVRWPESLADAGVEVIVPEITDYEVRRELLRADKALGLRRLDTLKHSAGVRYLPLSTWVMVRAAELWADARRAGQPTADAKALDCDVILAAQAQSLERDGVGVTVATSNVGHLSRNVHALVWRDVQPR